MSTRTIIEINHDYINNLAAEPGLLVWALLQAISTETTAGLNRGETPKIVPGMRVLGQRHHSTTLHLEVK